jgi:hypothetical protein
VLDVLAHCDTAADNKDIYAGLEGVFHDSDTDAVGGCERGVSRPLTYRMKRLVRLCPQISSGIPSHFPSSDGQ